MNQNINIKEVAEKAEVSIATVSRALNGNTLVKKATKDRILRIANELNYRPSPIARGLSMKKTDTIGLILPDLVGEFFMSVIHGIDEEAYKAKQYLTVSSSHSQRNIIETLMQFMSSGRVDGVILMAPKMHQDIPELLSKSKRPVVLLNSYQNHEEYVSISINNYQGAFASVEHLIGHGYKKISMIKGPNGNCEADERFSGYKDALKKYGIEVNDDLIIEGDFSIKSGYYAFMRLFSQTEKPEAVFASNDMMAIGVYEAAKTLNIKIPNDVAVVGFDDIFLTKMLSPRLTTVHVPITELSSRAVQYLLKMINGEVDRKDPHKEIISTGLVIGGSCGCNVTEVQRLIE